MTTRSASKKTIRVAIVDDDRDLAAGLAWIIDHTKGFRCTDTYSTLAQLREGLGKQRADVVLMDIGLGAENGIDGARIVTREFPGVHVIMQTVYSDDEKIYQSLRAGAVGYILKNTPPEQVLEAIQQANNGGAPMTGEVARKVLTFFKEEPSQGLETVLSDREREVLEELVRGHSYQAIADKLFLSIATVRFHLQNIYRKLHVRSRAEVVAKLGGDSILKRHLPG